MLYLTEQNKEQEQDRESPDTPDDKQLNKVAPEGTKETTYSAE